MEKIAFVIPWYGDDIRGGAETECNHLAHCLQRAGVSVEVFTTCVKQASDDRGTNTLKEGKFIESGILVRRFKVRKRNADRFHAANYKLYNGLETTIEDERDYFNEDINSPDMYEFIEKNQQDYKYFIFMPYLYGITYNGIKICPEKSIMIPCFHDESYAYMKLLKECAEKVYGMIFLSKPESDLAHRLFDLSKVKCAVLGAYVESGWEDNCKCEEFRKKYNIYGDFILYAGRKDPGKKADMLIKYYKRYRKKYADKSIKLVMIGGGEIDTSGEFSEDIIDLGFVSVEDKHNAMAAATFLCNPSFFESFSIVIMESWLAKRPVLVSEQCGVTTNFCLESNGGLYFDSFPVFCGCVNYLLEHLEIANKMGKNGEKYVKDNFIEKSIVTKYMNFLK